MKRLNGLLSLKGWALSLVFGIGALNGVPVVAGNTEAPFVEPEVIEPAKRHADWRGFYAGGTLGYAFGGSDDVGQRAPNGDLVASVGELKPGGFNYGLRLGWRNNIAFRSRYYVYGVELGYEAGSIDDDLTTNTHQASVDVKNVLSLRLKGGITSASGKMQYYGIVGYARGDIDYALAGTAGGDTIAVSDNSDYDGYTLGLGMERIVAEKVRLTLEYEFTQFDSMRLIDSSGSSTVATPSYGNIRVGLNYAF